MRHLVKLIEDYACVGVLLYVYGDVHLAAGGGIGDVGDTLYLLLLHKVGDAAHQVVLNHAVGYLRDDDDVVVGFGFYFGFCAHNDAAASGHECVAHTLKAEDFAAGREVRGLYIFHKLLNLEPGVVDECHGGVETFRKVVGRHICGHTHGDSRGSVDQEVGDSRREHGGFGEGVVEVGHEVDGVLVEVAEHLLTHFGKFNLCITHGGRRVAVDGAEVALSEDEGVTQGPVLGHAHHG